MAAIIYDALIYVRRPNGTMGQELCDEEYGWKLVKCLALDFENDGAWYIEDNFQVQFITFRDCRLNNGLSDHFHEKYQ